MNPSISYPVQNPQNDSYWDVRLSRSEIILLLSSAILILMIHLDPILHSRFALPLTIVLAGVCYLSPVTGFLFIACSQYLPFPEEASLNPSQIGFLVWLPIVLLRYSRVRLTGLWRLWPILPCLTWHMLMTGEKLYLPENNYFRALCYAVIACQLTNEARGQYLKCLLGLSLGAFLVMTAYWSNQGGLPVELSDWGSDREGIARTGGTRADAVMVWPALLIGVSGLAGIQLALGLARSPRPSPAWLTWLTVALCLGAFPTLISTMTYGCILAFVALSAGIMVVFVRLAWVGGFAPERVRLFVRLVVAAALLAATGYTTNFFSIRTKVTALKDSYKDTSREAGLFTSRNDVWAYSIETILKYPIFGIVNSRELEDVPPDYRDTPEPWLSHNVFLDYGRNGGITGMVLVAFFFFYPAWKMASGSQWFCFTPFLLTNLAMFIFWMSLSFVHYKTFWAFWILAAMAAASWPNDGEPRKRNRLQVEPEANSLKLSELQAGWHS
jgi:O-antigen ligase